ncbi:MAG: glyoxylate/hydroxypyruvate reductase A [Bradyrhizobiaceae bacterium]|nr:glyoxylate/hydroxypyruvate reductase A [Bradyrhizobiaceae bacterium]
MSALLLAITRWDPKEWAERFRALSPARDVRLWPDHVGDPRDIAYACVWMPPNGLLATFPNLQAIFSLGAGVDHLFADISLPHVPIVRIVDPDLTMRMREYVTLHVLLHHRRQHLYLVQQRERLWRDHDQPAASDVTVGIMGLGTLGRDSAATLKRIGFQVVGWSRRPKELPDIETFHGPTGLDPFLARSEILVVLLPATPATEGILSLSLLRKLKRDGALGGAYLINAGRGKLQIDADIQAALDEGSLDGASLDVFPIEPLSRQSPLWSHPKVTITPHNAAASVPRTLVTNILTQIERYEAGHHLSNVVDRDAGY